MNNKVNFSNSELGQGIGCGFVILAAGIAFYMFLIALKNGMPETAKDRCVKNNGIPVYQNWWGQMANEIKDCKFYLKK